MINTFPLTSIGGLVEGSYQLTGEQSGKLVLAPAGVRTASLIVVGSLSAFFCAFIILCGWLAPGPVLTRVIFTAVPAGIMLIIGVAIVGCSIWASRSHMRSPTLMSYDGQSLFLWGRTMEVAGKSVTGIELISAKCVEHEQMQSGIRKIYMKLTAIVVHYGTQSQDMEIVVAHLRGTISSSTMQGLQRICVNMNVKLAKSLRDDIVNFDRITAHAN